MPGSWVASIDSGCSYPGDLLLKPIVEVAGQDISHWFDPKTRDVSSAGTWCWGRGTGKQGWEENQGASQSP